MKHNSIYRRHLSVSGKLKGSISNNPFLFQDAMEKLASCPSASNEPFPSAPPVTKLSCTENIPTVTFTCKCSTINISSRYCLLSYHKRSLQFLCHLFVLSYLPFWIHNLFFFFLPLKVQKEMNKNPALKDGFTDAFQVNYMVTVQTL